LDREVEDGNDEAEWEEIVAKQAKSERVVLDGMRGKEGRWRDESVKAREKLFADIKEEMWRSRKFGERLNEVWQKERQLLRQERAQRSTAKFMERMGKKAMARGEPEVSREDDSGPVETTSTWKPMVDK
jgi:hypothetical protein